MFKRFLALIALLAVALGGVQVPRAACSRRRRAVAIPDRGWQAGAFRHVDNPARLRGPATIFDRSVFGVRRAARRS